MSVFFAVMLLVAVISGVLILAGLISDYLWNLFSDWRYDWRMKRLYGDLYFQVKRR